MVRCGLQQCASLLRSSVASSSNFSLLLLFFVKPLARSLEPRGQVRAGGAERASTVRDAALTATTGTSAPLLSRALEAMQGRTHCGPMVSGSRGERGSGSIRRTSSARSKSLPTSASAALSQPAGCARQSAPRWLKGANQRRRWFAPRGPCAVTLGRTQRWGERGRVSEGRRVAPPRGRSWSAR